MGSDHDVMLPWVWAHCTPRLILGGRDHGMPQLCTYTERRPCECRDYHAEVGPPYSVGHDHRVPLAVVPPGEYLEGDPNGLLSKTERQALEVSGALASLLAKVVDHGETRPEDLNELLGHIHCIQHAIMAQAAARAYPQDYRRLGATLP